MMASPLTALSPADLQMADAEAIHTRQLDPYSAVHHPALPPRRHLHPPRSRESRRRRCRRHRCPRDSQPVVEVMSFASWLRKAGIGHWDTVPLWAAEACWPEP